MKIPFVGGAYQGRSRNLNDQVCDNFFPVMDNEQGKYVVALMGTPGLTEWVDLSNANEIRGMHQIDDVLYVVCGANIYSYTTAGVKTTLTGDTLSNTTGRVYMASSDTYLMLVNPSDGKGYTVDLTGSAVLEIADVDFPSASTVTFLDTYFIVTKTGTDDFYISASGDPTSWNALDSASASDKVDNLVIGFTHLRDIWMFGKKTIEVYYNSGASFPFTRIGGSSHNVGIMTAESLATVDDYLFLFGNDRSVYINNNLQLVRISTSQIEYQIEKMTTVSDAIGFAYKQEGHSFYVLSFPTENKTFVYDLASAAWHTRSTGTPTTSRHPVNCYALFNNKHLVGHKSNGKIYYYDFDKYTDDGTTLRRTRRARAVHADRKRVFHNILEIEFEAGTALATGQGSDPQAMLRWSDDDGHTWSNEHWASIGKIGQYKNRARWKKLGSSRSRVYEVTFTDPVRCVIMDAQLEGSVGAH